MTTFAYIFALFWGFFWAGCLQFTGWGRFLAVRRTWVTVVVGIGVDLLIMLPIIPLNTWIAVVAIIVLSAIGIIARSLYNEYTETREEMDRARRTRVE